MEIFHIGIDDTDSPGGMCTTYVAALLAERLSGFSSIRTLKLVRLNPNIPWKTRGNASVGIEIETEEIERAKRLVLDVVEKYSEIKEENTDPGVVFLTGPVPEQFKKVYQRALHEIVPLKDAENAAEGCGADIHRFKKGRGVIGALAAIGSDFNDHTHEIIAYRLKENYGKDREIKKSSVYKMDALTSPMTFNNIDYVENRILITPRSPCPVLFGIRGENPEILDRAFKIIKTGEGIERVAKFETNQCTDAHLEHINCISEIKPYSSVILKGRVAKEPRIIGGGHVIFTISDGHSDIDCAAYEPTKDFRWLVRELREGDIVRVYGGVRGDGKRTINLEKLEVVDLAVIYNEKNPVCGMCGRSMKSAGTGQGFRCKKCKTKAGEKIRIEVERDLKKGIYQVPPSAMRHLSKPLVREIYSKRDFKHTDYYE